MEVDFHCNEAFKPCTMMDERIPMLIAWAAKSADDRRLGSVSPRRNLKCLFVRPSPNGPRSSPLQCGGMTKPSMTRTRSPWLQMLGLRLCCCRQSRLQLRSLKRCGGAASGPSTDADCRMLAFDARRVRTPAESEWQMAIRSRASWIQEFCLLMTTTNTQTREGDLVELAANCHDASPDVDPADAVQRVLLERELKRRRRLQRPSNT